jgi:cellulose synthase/poly-beta-1,6-N-acetylglucosamine synthase-like glycosyltransferase
LLTIADIADRILCWELVSKRNSNWILHYVKSASAITDVPDGVSRPKSPVVWTTSAYP